MAPYIFDIFLILQVILSDLHEYTQYQYTIINSFWDVAIQRYVIIHICLNFTEKHNLIKSKKML